MPLTRFKDVALDWSSVYAVRVVDTSYDGLEPNKIEIRCHLVGGDPGAVTIPITGVTAIRVWKRVAEDARFAIINKHREPLAVDLSKIAAVFPIDQKESVITFDLGNQRGLSLKLDRNMADELLEKVPQPPQ